MKYLTIAIMSSIIVSLALKNGNMWLMFFAGIVVGISIGFALIERELSKYK